MSVRDTIRSVRHWLTIAPSVPSTYQRGLSAAARSECTNSASTPSTKRMVTREWSALVTSNQRRLWEAAVTCSMSVGTRSRIWSSTCEPQS